MKTNDMAIGVFDSGIGGLTVLRELIKALPRESTIYLGDTARVPYGVRSRGTVLQYSFDCTRFLFLKGIKLLVIACNTVSALGLDEIGRLSPVPVVGVILPGARAAVRASKSGKIGVIGTEATIKSRAYIMAIKSLNGKSRVFGLPCPLFVPLVEEGWTRGQITRLTAERYLWPLKKKGVDTLLLGCTHYPLLKPVIAEVIGSGVTLIDSAVETVKEVKGVLKKYGLESRLNRPMRQFYVTDSPEKFKLLGEGFLKRKIKGVRLVRIGGAQ